MGYRVQLPPPGPLRPPTAGSPISEKPVTLVTGGNRRAHEPAVARLLGMPLTRFALEGSPLEIRAPWLPVTLWLVPSEADAETLAQEGVSRGRVWTARELADLLTTPGLTKEHARIFALVKLEFDGEVVEVRSPEGSW